jgi:hypothetical protein
MTGTVTHNPKAAICVQRDELHKSLTFSAIREMMRDSCNSSLRNFETASGFNKGATKVETRSPKHLRAGGSGLIKIFLTDYCVSGGGDVVGDRVL